MEAKPVWRKGINRWVVDTRPKGIKKINDSKGEQKKFTSRSDAVEYAVKVNSAQSKGGVITEAQSGTIDAAIAEFKNDCDSRVDEGLITYLRGESLKNYLDDFADLDLNGQRFGDHKCKEITTADISRKLIKQLKPRANQKHLDSLSPKTIKEKLGALKLLFELAIECQWAFNNPAKAVKLEKPKYKKKRKDKNTSFRPDGKLKEIKIKNIKALIETALANERIVGNTPWCDGLAVAFAAQTGLRFGEQAALHWSEVDFKNNRVIVEKSVRKVGDKIYEIQDIPKTESAYRRVPITPQLVAQLKAWKIRSPFSDLVFPTSANLRTKKGKIIYVERRSSFHKMSSNWYRRVLHPACDQAGIDRIRWHDLRHVYASILLELHGENFHKITKRMGHKSLSTTRELYGHWIDDPETDAIDAKEFGDVLWA